MTSSDSSSSVRVISSLRSGGASRSDPEASSSGVSSEPPSSVDARALRDLEVMKADHDLDTAVTEGSLAMIRGRYNIPAEYGLHVPQPGQRPTVRTVPTCASRWMLWRPVSDRMDLSDLRGMPKVSGGKAPSTRTTAREVGVSPAREAPKASSKRPVDAPAEQVDDPARRHKKGKEPAAPSEEPDTPAKSEEGGASPVHRRPRSMKDLFKTKVHKDDAGYYTLQMSDLGHQDPDKEMKARWRGLKNSTKVWNDSSAAEEFERGLLHPQLARELYMLPSEVFLARAVKEMVLELEKTKRERDEELLRREASEKDLNEVRSNLGEVQQLLKEARVRARKMDDELLQAVKALESARAELPRQAVVQYKESVGFKERLKRMGRVTYEYGYRVALARFHAQHPNSEVEEDPFTIHPEDDLVPMEKQQAFDDSDPPEP
ncbi:hypothetical protein BHE74_00023004 [Ensete ventricosum]|nr:hypothetical protein BHE74_00023004 [Ensete ventricosum]